MNFSGGRKGSGSSGGGGELAESPASEPAAATTACSPKESAISAAIAGECLELILRVSEVVAVGIDDRHAEAAVISLRYDEEVRLE